MIEGSDGSYIDTSREAYIEKDSDSLVKLSRQCYGLSQIDLQHVGPCIEYCMQTACIAALLVDHFI